MTDAKNETLFRATGRLLRERGFAGTSIRAIAKHADMLPGSVTYRFATKDELVIAMMRHGIHNATTALRDALDKTEGAIQLRASEILRTMLRLLASDSNAAWLLRHEWDRLPDSVRDALEDDMMRFDAFTSSILEGAAQNGIVRPGLDLVVLQRILEGATTGAAALCADNPNYDTDAVADVLASVITDGMLDFDRVGAQRASATRLSTTPSDASKEDAS